MDWKSKNAWNKRNVQLAFYNFYLKYLLGSGSTTKQLENLECQCAFSLFEKSATVSVLKQTISGLINLNNGFVGNSSTPTVELSASKPSTKMRFDQDNFDELSTEQVLQPLREHFSAMSCNKVEQDIETIRYALQICLDDLRENHQLRKMVEFIIGKTKEVHDEYNLINAYSENLIKIKDLELEMKKVGQNHEKLINQLNDELLGLKKQAENCQKQHKSEVEMVNMWEQAKQEQVETIFNHEIADLAKKREKLVRSTERELTVINEVKKFYLIKCERLKTTKRIWQERLEIECSQMEEDIKQAHNDIKNVKLKCEEIKSLYEERQKFVDQHHEELRMLQKQEKRRLSAVIIQAWWRETMVRKQLGPYKPKKVKLKKGKGGKKKSK